MAARSQPVNGLSTSTDHPSSVDTKTMHSLHLLQQEIDGTNEPAKKAGCYLLQGLLYAKYGLHVEAIRAYEEALVFSPDNPMVCAKLADSLGQTGLTGEGRGAGDGRAVGLLLDRRVAAATAANGQRPQYR